MLTIKSYLSSSVGEKNQLIREKLERVERSREFGLGSFWIIRSCCCHDWLSQQDHDESNDVTSFDVVLSIEDDRTKVRGCPSIHPARDDAIDVRRRQSTSWHEQVIEHNMRCGDATRNPATWTETRAFLRTRETTGRPKNALKSIGKQLRRSTTCEDDENYNY